MYVAANNRHYTCIHSARLPAVRGCGLSWLSSPISCCDLRGRLGDHLGPGEAEGLQRDLLTLEVYRNPKVLKTHKLFSWIVRVWAARNLCFLELKVRRLEPGERRNLDSRTSAEASLKCPLRSDFELLQDPTTESRQGRTVDLQQYFEDCVKRPGEHGFKRFCLWPPPGKLFARGRCLSSSAQVGTRRDGIALFSSTRRCTDNRPVFSVVLVVGQGWRLL